MANQFVITNERPVWPHATNQLHRGIDHLLFHDKENIEISHLWSDIDIAVQ